MILEWFQSPEVIWFWVCNQKYKWMIKE
jgi:hypothetical protein